MPWPRPASSPLGSHSASSRMAHVGPLDQWSRARDLVCDSAFRGTVQSPRVAGRLQGERLPEVTGAPRPTNTSLRTAASPGLNLRVGQDRKSGRLKESASPELVIPVHPSSPVVSQDPALQPRTWCRKLGVRGPRGGTTRATRHLAPKPTCRRQHRLGRITQPGPRQLRLAPPASRPGGRAPHACR